MIQNPQRIPQALQIFPPKAMPPSGKSSEKSPVSTTRCLSSCENSKKRMRNSDDPEVSCTPSDHKLTLSHIQSKVLSTTSPSRFKNQTRMIQNPQQELQLFPTKAMPPSGKSSEKSPVSTTLCLSSCENPKKRRRNSDDPEVSCRPSDHKLTNGERKVKRTRNLSNEERAKKERDGVSTELRLFKDPWTIKKVLTTSDLGPLSRLLLQIGPIEEDVLKYLNEDDQNNLQQGLGITVNVYDHDTNSTFELLLKRWTTLNCYVLIGGWRRYFVRRRGLRKGDEIGLFWNPFASRLHFRVFSRALTEVLVDQKKYPN